ncbi:MAG: hypothetical protein Q7U28_09250 [Aquabacterium sp.]|nr:hypothetical protein [Aquabacterium sp.]
MNGIPKSLTPNISAKVEKWEADSSGITFRLFHGWYSGERGMHEFRVDTEADAIRYIRSARPCNCAVCHDRGEAFLERNAGRQRRPYVPYPEAESQSNMAAFMAPRYVDLDHQMENGALIYSEQRPWPLRSLGTCFRVEVLSSLGGNKAVFKQYFVEWTDLQTELVHVLDQFGARHIIPYAAVHAFWPAINPVEVVVPDLLWLKHGGDPYSVGHPVRAVAGVFTEEMKLVAVSLPLMPGRRPGKTLTVKMTAGQLLRKDVEMVRSMPNTFLKFGSGRQWVDLEPVSCTSELDVGQAVAILDRFRSH